MRWGLLQALNSSGFTADRASRYGVKAARSLASSA